MECASCLTSAWADPRGWQLKHNQRQPGRDPSHPFPQSQSPFIVRRTQPSACCRLSGSCSILLAVDTGKGTVAALSSIFSILFHIFFSCFFSFLFFSYRVAVHGGALHLQVFLVWAQGRLSSILCGNNTIFK